MLEEQVMRRDGDYLSVVPQSQLELVEHLRSQLTPREQRMFGIDEAYDPYQPAHEAGVRIATGLGATATTTALFAVFAFFATLGLPVGATLAGSLV